MANFTHLRKLAADKIVEYKMPELGPDAALTLRCANEGNSGYMNDLLRLTGQAKGARSRKVKVDAKSLDEMRGHDKDLYPKHVIVGWSGVPDHKGKDVEYTPSEGSDLLRDLPNHLFDEMRNFATDPENFVKVVIDSEQKAKN